MDEDSMLATTNKMTGLDLASRPAERETKRSITDEMLSTPKIPDSAGTLMSPRFMSYSSSSYSSSRVHTSAGNGDRNGNTSAANNGCDDMLMTPVLTTPNTADVWSSRRACEAVDFSPENLSASSDLDLAAREPPKDLPMDSDIGLRSPCDGLLAKRRKQMREMSKRAGSFNSDSNSCDTPTSENSPRDLTTGPPRTSETDVVKRNQRNTSPSSNAPAQSPTVKRGNLFEPSSPRPPPPLLPPPSVTDDRRYKDFKRPANLTMINGISKENDIPAHCNPSPLAVPSPNWSVVERYFGGEMIKTPKNLDTSNVFDFLGLPPPSTPRSKLYRDRSPNYPSDCYSGRDQRLSPRLSPRFPIPEAPTDLSGRPPPLARVSELIANEAEDLSTRGSKSRNVPLSPQNLPRPASSTPAIFTHTVAVTPPPVKMEYNPSPPRVTPPPENPSSQPMVSVKTETQMNLSQTSSSNLVGREDYDYCGHVPHVPPPPPPAPSCFPNSFYLPSNFHPSYHRHIYGHPELERPSPPRTVSPLRQAYERSPYHQPWPGINPHHLQHHQHHHHLQHQLQQQQQQHDLHSHGTSGGGLMMNSHSWTTPIKEEPSITPPPPSSSVPPPNYSSLKSSLMIKSSSSLMDGMHERKRSPRKTSNDSNETEEKRGRKKSKTKANKEQQPVGPGESKRVYTCPHCQRAYDWNYNLNRHLKYECGKENAFQCGKCGRKFPHKQNCVYHLKRKHKINFETIDQYVSAGLVVFSGASDPTGHVEARPVSHPAN